MMTPWNIISRTWLAGALILSFGASCTAKSQTPELMLDGPLPAPEKRDDYPEKGCIVDLLGINFSKRSIELGLNGHGGLYLDKDWGYLYHSNSGVTIPRNNQIAFYATLEWMEYVDTSPSDYRRLFRKLVVRVPEASIPKTDSILIIFHPNNTITCERVGDPKEADARRKELLSLYGDQ